MRRIGEARVAQRKLGSLPLRERNSMLFAVADALERQSDAIFAANTTDLETADREGLSVPLRKRLVFDSDKLAAVCGGVRQVASLADPVGRVRERRLLDEGLVLERVDVPIGVIGMIFESRPDALVQILSLCLKSGNAIVLKGGREALGTNRAIVAVIRDALAPFAVGSGWIVHLESRGDVRTMLELDDAIDLIIPRGSNEFVRYIMDNTRIPVLGHADGLCAIYVDARADIDRAVRVSVDSKCQYPAVCNAVETILVHREVAAVFLKALEKALEPWKVVIHGDARTRAIIDCMEATDADWDTEYLAYEMAVKIVDSQKEAMDHIALHGSGHTDCIVTEDASAARTFLREIDSADVFWNCSTRFSDGFRYGLGAEVGISTQKIHARGPVGLDGLVVGKWLLAGNGQVVADYAGGKPFLHIDMPLDGSSLMGDNR